MYSDMNIYVLVMTFESGNSRWPGAGFDDATYVLTLTQAGASPSKPWRVQLWVVVEWPALGRNVVLHGVFVY